MFQSALLYLQENLIGSDTPAFPVILPEVLINNKQSTRACRFLQYLFLSVFKATKSSDDYHSGCRMLSANYYPQITQITQILHNRINRNSASISIDSCLT